MARNFNGTTAVLTAGPGRITTFSGFVIAAIARITAADGSFRAIASLYNSSNVTQLNLGRNSNNDINNDGLNPCNAPLLRMTSADGWALYAIKKAAGSSTARFFEYLYASDTKNVENDNVATNDPGTISGGGIKIGAWFDGTNADFFAGDIAAVGIWDTHALTLDDDIWSLAFSRQRWLSADELFLLDQADTAQKVASITGDSRESAITGTTVGTSSVPLFNRTHGVWIPSRSPAAGGSAVDIAAAVSGQATVTADLTISRDLQAAITGQASIGADLLRQVALNALITGQGEINANLAGAVALQAVVDGTAIVVANLVEAKQLQAAIGGFAVVVAELQVNGVGGAVVVDTRDHQVYITALWR